MEEIQTKSQSVLAWLAVLDSGAAHPMVALVDEIHLR